MSKATHMQEISFQVAKTASLMGANCVDETGAESNSGFAHALGIVERSVGELLWLFVSMKKGCQTRSER